jgi:hypothetical protein
VTHTVILRGPSQRALAKRLIDHAPDDYVVTIREQTRTGEASDKMWAMLSDISRAKPGGRRHTPEMWKAIFMKACGHHVQFCEGIDGEPFPVGFRSSKLSKSQMRDLIDFIDAWAAENGVQWSNEYRSEAA